MQEVTVFPQEEPAVQPKLVLVVEDDLELGAMLVQAIRDETPHHAILASNGVEALNIVRHLKCDVFLIDYHLPLMNALELYDRLHALPGHEQTLALIFSADPRLPSKELAQRRLKSVTKPARIDELLGMLGELLSV